MTQEKILDKLGKIKAMAESAKAIGNEAEAQAFAAMLQQLLLKHKLDLSDVDYAKEMKDEPIIEQRAEVIYKDGKRFYKDFPDVEVVSRRVEWSEDLAAVIGDAYSCRFLVTPGRSYITFVGHKSNVAICEYLFLTMLRAAENMSLKAARAFRMKARAENGGAGSTPRGYRESWLDGFTSRIRARLQEERAQFNTSGSMALVRVNKEAIAVRSYIDDKYKKKAASLGGVSSFNRSGYQDGTAAANAINIKGNAMNAASSMPNKQIGGN